MRPPVRKVCGGCLRSVEIPSPGSGDTEVPSSNECPYCGGEIESSSASIAPSGNGFSPTDRIVGPSLTPSGSGETIDWAETWNRGTLGVIGRYQLRERLGEGGFGQVFQAFDPRLDRDVALKVLKQPNPTERVMQRFFREARAAARLDHPNIVAVHDAGFENGRCWIAYQYISGRPLWWYRNHHRLDHPTCARIVRDLADALAHAHRLGVLHRDLKPANVIMDDQGRPRLTDFGLARRSDLDSSLTRDGATVGTPAYMSPEQAQGNSNSVDERSDIYSLGVIFYELLHGRRPRESCDESESSPVSGVIANRFGGFSRRDGNAGPPVPASLQRICDKALTTSTEARYPNARSLAEDLDRWLSRNRPETSNQRRLAGPAAIAAAMLLACAGLAAALFPFQSRPSQTRGTSTPNPFLKASTPSPPPSKLEAGERIQGNSSTKTAASSPTKKPAPGPDEAYPAAVIANLDTRKYHKPMCSYVQSMSKEHRRPFESVTKARKEGYTPCTRCYPPKQVSPARSGRSGTSPNDGLSKPAGPTTLDGVDRS